MNDAAACCIPKFPVKKKQSHDIPMWRERISVFRNDVDYWTQLQYLQGGPNLCHAVISQQLCLSKSIYRNQIRQLRREVEINLAESTTLNNCHKHLFKKSKVPAPAMIEGHSRPAQPKMWREHFKGVFKAENSPYQGNLLCNIDAEITDSDVANFKYVELKEINRRTDQQTIDAVCIGSGSKIDKS